MIEGLLLLAAGFVGGQLSPRLPLVTKLVEKAKAALSKKTS